jgi:YD repeat-containing protein
LHVFHVDTLQEFSYNEHGGVVRSVLRHADAQTPQIVSGTAYQHNGNHILSQTDARGKTVTHDIDENTDLTRAVTDPNGQQVQYAYDSARRVTQVSASAGGKQYKNAYAYENDRLKTVSHNTDGSAANNVTYRFAYDAVGRPTETHVGSRLLSRNVYNADGTLARSEYRDPSYPEANSTATLTWQDGNIVSISTIDGRDNETTTFSYTEHLNPWNGIDIGAFMIGDAEESAMLLGISGTTVKNLPASRQDGNSTMTYTYTFDAEGRVSTIVTEENWQDGGGSGSERTEYTLHYGPQTVSKPDYIPYLTKQEVVDEGTLPYTFSEDNPDEKWYGVNAYTSYAKIRSTMSDGRTSEKTEYRQININPSTQEGLVLGYLYITQDEADNFRLVSTSFNEIPLGENEINPHRFVYTLEYNCFTVNLEFDVFYPSCTVFDPATGEQKTHWMPMLPLDKNCFTVSEPELRYMGENTDENGPTSEYYYRQEYLFQVNRDVEPTEYDYQLLSRHMYVAHY